MKRVILSVLSLALGVVAASAIPTYTFNQVTPDGDVDATASFSISGNMITIVLTDLEPNPISAGQLISGILFNATGATSGSLTTSSGVLANVGDGGSVLNGGAAVTLDHWGLSFSGGSMSIVMETAGGAAQGGTPVDMIIGPDSKGGFNPTNYTAANPSITGNHQPSVLGSATFTITTTGTVTGITGVQMAFGTGPDTTIPGVPNTQVPDGASTVLLLGGALTVLGLIRRKLNRTDSPGNP